MLSLDNALENAWCHFLDHEPWEKHQVYVPCPPDMQTLICLTTSHKNRHYSNINASAWPHPTIQGMIKQSNTSPNDPWNLCSLIPPELNPKKISQELHIPIGGEPKKIQIKKRELPVLHSCSNILVHSSQILHSKIQKNKKTKKNKIQTPPLFIPKGQAHNRQKTVE